MADIKKIATRVSYGNTLVELAQQGADNLVVFDADLAAATKPEIFRKEYPDRHFDCGIAEQNMVGVAAGMSTLGYVPFVSSFAMFVAGRGFEQIRNSIGYPHLNVKIAATHAGLSVGEDGASHQCCEDLALMRSIPGMVILSPADDVEARAAVIAAYNYNGPVYLRFGRLAVPVINDAVGGVAVRCMDDLTAYDPSLTEGAEITLMGDQALYYVRARMNAGDQTNIRRMERQRQYMLELWKDVSAAGAQDPDFLAKLVLNLGDKLQTDCSSTQMQTLFDSVSALDVNEIKTIDGESVKGEKFMEFYADDASLQQTVIDLFYDRVSEN